MRELLILWPSPDAVNVTPSYALMNILWDMLQYVSVSQVFMYSGV